MNQNTREIIRLHDGNRSSVEVAQIVDLTPRYVRKVAGRLGLPRLHRGAQYSCRNHQYVCGRRIDLDGYVLVTAPPKHPSARQRKNRKSKLIYEHRLVMERRLGRYLQKAEVVDHVDSLTLHNDPENLRIFHCNADHLRKTLSKKPMWSSSGYRNIGRENFRPEVHQRVDTYYRRRERGDVRLLQILLAAVALGIDSPFLLGTHRHLEKAGICQISDSTIKLALDGLYRKFEEDLLL